jgi:protoporphyrinogen oxidase
VEKEISHKNNNKLAILGGGPGGLAAGYFAKKNNLPFIIYEAEKRAGGNCITLQHGEFYFDSGAHRFHDKIPDITSEIKNLMGDNLAKLSVPSQIYFNQKLVDFPLSPLNLLKNLGLFSFIKAGFEVIGNKLKKKGSADHFEHFALRTYGKTIANLFLLNYSEKLWGAPCNRLSPHISGKRMKGLDLKTFLKEAVLGSKAKTEHLDGSFYYPRTPGIGALTGGLESFCGSENIMTNARITRIFHNDRRIQAVEINGEKRVDTDDVISTLPINQFIMMMDPSPAGEVIDQARSLRFRNIVLVALFLDLESINRAATVYFPDDDFPFTRLYEARNRNALMSPPGKTSAVVEIPCQSGDRFWTMDDKQLIGMVREKLVETGLFKNNQVIDSTVYRMRDAYPILEVGVDQKIEHIFAYLKRFENLRISGRNGRFLYTHVHDMMQFGKEIIANYPFR